jgi:hypothetical protein
MLMTDQTYELVQSGLPFREAYIKVKSQQEAKFVSKTFLEKTLHLVQPITWI